MVKRLIFDLDNTLISWKLEYNKALERTIEHYQLPVSEPDLYRVTKQYEAMYPKYERYDKNLMVDLINKNFPFHLGPDFIEHWLIELGDMAEIDEELITLLEYLSSKYELVILTNWFTSSQVVRMKKAKIYDYFKEVYGAEEYMKPSPQAFKMAMGGINRRNAS